MSTSKSATFNSMLNEYIAYSDILETTFISQNWLMQNANMIKTWQGGNLVVPVQQSYASSVKMGGLTDLTPVTGQGVDGASYLRGGLSGYKEAYGTLQFHSRDLFLDHFTVSVQNFLKILPDQIDQLMKYFKQTVSIQVLNGGYLDEVSTAFDAATNVLAVKHPDRFQIGQYLILNDGLVASISGYVTSINMNTGVLGFMTQRGGAVPVVLTTLTEASTKVYIDGGTVTSFNSMRQMLLPAAVPGGSATWAGLTKTDAPYLQSILYDAGGLTGVGDWNTGVAVKGTNVLDLVFDAMRKGYQLGAEPKKFVMSFKHYSSCLKAIEKGSGAYKNIKPSVSYAGYSSIEVGGVSGSCELVGIREMMDDVIYGIDTKFLDFHCGNMPWKVMKSPDGLNYFTERTTSGYLYTTDIVFAGDFLYRNPSSSVVIFNIPDYLFNV
jgi:hypothetical protein